MSDKPICSVDGCDRPRRAREFCHPHYNKWRRENINVAANAEDPAAGFCKRLTEFLTTAPEGLLSDGEIGLIIFVAYSAAVAQRGLIPITEETRRQALIAAVNAATADPEAPAS